MMIKRIINVWKNYIGSQFLVMMFVFLTNLLAGWATGLHFPFVSALAAGICELIPGFGSFISWGITAFLGLVFGSSVLDIADWQYALLITGCSILIQCLEDWLISPMIIGKKMELPPLIVFFGVLFASAAFGFWGMILAVPVLASLKEIKNYSAERRIRKLDRLQYVLPAKDMLKYQHVSRAVSFTKQ